MALPSLSWLPSSAWVIVSRKSLICFESSELTIGPRRLKSSPRSTTDCVAVTSLPSSSRVTVCLPGYRYTNRWPIKLRHRTAAVVSSARGMLFFTVKDTRARPSTTLIFLTLPTTTPAILTLSFGSSPVTSSKFALSV